MSNLSDITHTDLFLGSTWEEVSVNDNYDNYWKNISLLWSSRLKPVRRF